MVKKTQLFWNFGRKKAKIWQVLPIKRPIQSTSEGKISLAKGIIFTKIGLANDYILNLWAAPPNQNLAENPPPCIPQGNDVVFGPNRRQVRPQRQIIHGFFTDTLNWFKLTSLYNSIVQRISRICCSDRSGWIPTIEDLSRNLAAQYGWIYGLSVTEMEIVHGAFRKFNPNGE